MSSVYKLEALATKAVLTKYSSLESFPDRGRRLVMIYSVILEDINYLPD